MEKRTAGKAKKWTEELSIQKERQKHYQEKAEKAKEASKGQYIPKKYIEPYSEPYGEIEHKAKNNERLVLYIFIGLIACILTWKGFDFLQERYWVDELKTGSKTFLTELEKRNQRTSSELKKITQSFQPKKSSYTPPPKKKIHYQYKTKDFLKSRICLNHIERMDYERVRYKCNKSTNKCTVISRKNIKKHGAC